MYPPLKAARSGSYCAASASWLSVSTGVDWQSAEQPSPSAVLSSSHISSGSRMPSPHSPGQNGRMVQISTGDGFGPEVRFAMAQPRARSLRGCAGSTARNTNPHRPGLSCISFSP